MRDEPDPPRAGMRQFLPRRLTDEERTSLYGLLCDAIERGYQGLPQATGEGKFLHTSPEARATANRVMQVLVAEQLIAE